MKKILLASTILAASAGVAAAEVAVSGTARMGVVVFDNDNDATTANNAQFSSRIRIIFTASGETDNGLSFGGSVRNDQSGVGGTNNGDSTVFISGAFGKLTMGDTGNAVDGLLGQVSSVGYTGLGSMNELGFLGKNTTGASYEYSAGALTFGLGVGQTEAGPANDLISAAVKYSTDAYTVGLGYEDVTFGSQITLSGSTTFSGATLKAKIVDGDASTDTRYALSVDYAMNGIGLTVFYADHSDFGAVTGYAGALNGKAYGLGMSYDLGGGAAVKAGIARNEGKDSVADLGVTMSF